MTHRAMRDRNDAAPETTPCRILVGISGASGAVYGLQTLRILHRSAGVETHLVVTDAARRTIATELDMPLADLERLADVVHDVRDIGAPPATGSFPMTGMIVAPCSVHTLAAIASSLADNLLLRAADVTLKERRPLVLMVRETPLHLGHIRAMQAVTEMGAVVCPPVPAFYIRPNTLEDVIAHTVTRALSLLPLPVADPHAGR